MQWQARTVEKRAGLLELLPPEAMDDHESPDAVSAAVELREKDAVAAAAAASSYRGAFVAAGASASLAHAFKAGDFVSFRLPKLLSALDRPRVLCIVLKITRAGTFSLYCQHGVIMPSQVAEVLELAPPSELPPDLNWNVADLLAEHKDHPKIISVDDLIRTLTRRTDKPTTATSAELKAITDKQAKALERRKRKLEKQASKIASKRQAKSADNS